MNEQLKIIISAEINKFKQNVDDARNKIKDFVQDKDKIQEFNDEFQKVGDTSKKILATMGTAIIGAGAALMALSSAGKEHAENQAKLATAFETAGSNAAVAKETYNDLYRVLGDSGQATEAAQHLAQLTTEEQALNEWTTICQGVYATFGDSLPIESLTEAVNHTAKLGEVQGPLADALEWTGINVDDFNEKLFECNTEAEREALIRDTLSGKYNEAAANYEKNAAGVLAQNEAQAKMEESLAALNEALAPVMNELKLFGTEILAMIAPQLQEFVDNYGPEIKEVLTKIADAIGKVLSWVIDNWELVSTIAIVIAGICAALTVFSTVMGIVNAVMLASPVTWIVLAIVAAIAALVAIIIVVIKYWDEIKAATEKCWNAIVNAVKVAIDWIVNLFKKIIDWVKQNWQGLLLLLVNPFAGAFKLLYDNCDGFRNFINGFIDKIKNGIKNGFEAVKNNIINPIKNAFNSVKSTFSNIVSTISEKLGAARDKVKSIIDKIKGFFKFEWSLPKLKVPKFSITPSGWKIGDLLEGVIPKLGITWNARGGVFDKPTLFNYGNSLQGLGENGAEAVVPLENNLEWLDKLADRLASKMGTGTPVVLQVDGKTFAQTTIKTLNQNTRQTGKLGINIV